MIDLSTLDAALMLARGQYATVRAAHEDALKEMQILCGLHASYGSRMLKTSQPSMGSEITGFDVLHQSAIETLEKIKECEARVESLHAQREELRSIAWKR